MINFDVQDKFNFCIAKFCVAPLNSLLMRSSFCCGGWCFTPGADWGNVAVRRTMTPDKVRGHCHGEPKHVYMFRMHTVKRMLTYMAATHAFSILAQHDSHFVRCIEASDEPSTLLYKSYAKEHSKQATNHQPCYTRATPRNTRATNHTKELRRTL